VRQTFKNMQRLMAKAGGSLNDVVSMTVFVCALPEIMVEVTGYAVVGK
jgi:enamine deaminase RidA (YjgF/YER057c/UK114 family)